MDVDELPRSKGKTSRRKVFEVNTRKPDASKELEKYLNPANQFEEMMTPRARRGIPSVYRYFFYKPDPINGPPKGFFETIVHSISSIVAPVAQVEAPASQGSNGPANMADLSVDTLLHKMRNVGVDSQTDFDQMVEMLESKLNISGGAQKKKSLKRHLKRSRTHHRKGRGHTHKK